MKKIVLIVLFSISAKAFSQAPLPESMQKTMIAKMKTGDSLVFYQCHVEEVTQQLSTASGQSITTAPQKYSITEKFIVYKDSSAFKAKYFVSSMVALPNRRFSGLKIREKAYWNFKKVNEKTLDEKSIKVLAAIENKGREPNEYDFAITKYNTNQVIIRKKKNDFKQLVIEGNYVLSKLLFE